MRYLFKTHKLDPSNPSCHVHSYKNHLTYEREFYFLTFPFGLIRCGGLTLILIEVFGRGFMWADRNGMTINLFFIFLTI